MGQSPPARDIKVYQNPSLGGDEIVPRVRVERMKP